MPVMRSENTTIKDIAKALGLSNSTVSRALKDSYKISKAIRLKVQEYALEKNYRPNLVAQSLRNNKSRSIGILIPAIPNSFFAEVINGIESVAHDRNYHVSITQSLESYKREKENLEHLIWRSVDGLLISLSTETENFEHLQKVHDKNIPIVFFDRVTDSFETHQVKADNAEGTYKATKHLLDNGYRKIAHITSSPNISITKERLEGYYQALSEFKIEVNEDYIQYCYHGGMEIKEVETVLDKLLNMTIAPNAVIAASDRISIAVMALLHKRKISIPKELAVVGFTNFSYPEIFSPSLTTVKQPAFEMGKQATELLIELIESKRPVTKFEKRILSTELTIRDSTKRKGKK
jgi:DNA-binding LacI/PurR family transcriptional regulator